MVVDGAQMGGPIPDDEGMHRRSGQNGKTCRPREGIRGRDRGSMARRNGSRRLILGTTENGEIVVGGSNLARRNEERRLKPGTTGKWGDWNDGEIGGLRSPLNED